MFIYQFFFFVYFYVKIILNDMIYAKIIVIKRREISIMERKEIEKLKKISNMASELGDILSNKNYDFNRVKLDDKFLDFVMVDQFDVELKKIKEEKERQSRILYDAKKRLEFEYQDCSIIDYICKVISYENYYLVKIYGSPFEKVDLIYYKNGNLLNYVSRDRGSIDAVDDRNFFVLDKEKNVAFHKRIDSTGTSCFNVQVLDHVYSCVLPIFGKELDVEFGNLVGWIGAKNDEVSFQKNVLYNYKTGNIVIPEYTDATYYYGMFSNFVHRDDLIHIIQGISYDGLVSRLEFLIDKDGVLCTDVYDFARSICYSTQRDGKNQSDVLNSIYEEVRDYLKNKADEKRYLRVKK